MYTINDIIKEFKRLDMITGANISTYPVRISKRCVYKMGSFKFQHRTQQGEIITFNYSFTFADFILKENSAIFYDTVRHEYAHALTLYLYNDVKIGHGTLWVKCCKIVDCKPRATTIFAGEAQEQRIQKHEMKKRKVYKVTCDTCGTEWRYKKKSNIVKCLLNERLGSFRCPHCGTRNNFSLSTYIEQIG